jgi:glutathione synthase/RimK-type ligase-like ATP-grasp enzyme
VKIWCLNDQPFDRTGAEVAKAARERGHLAEMFCHAHEVSTPGYGFMRLAQYAPRAAYDKQVAHELAPRLKMIQDRDQIDLYEDKIGQVKKWPGWLPQTMYFQSAGEAEAFADKTAYPFVSKSREGSSSHNVRILQTRDDAQAEIEAVFRGKGLPVMAGPLAHTQRGYVLWQRFIPHQVTWRVTIIGTKIHIYKRFCYPDKNVAAPAKVVPTEAVFQRTRQIEDLEDFSRDFFHQAGTKWCAIDVVWEEEESEWWLLETSLAWARGDDAAGNAPFFDSPYSLLEQHYLLIREIEAGVFGDT